MLPATTRTTGTTFSDQKNLEKQIQKQMGCMTGFFQLLDRHNSLTDKRIHSAKRLPSPPPVKDSASESGQFEQPRPATPPRSKSNRSTPQLNRSSTKTPPPSIYPLEIKEATITNRTCWKFREAPRLSLDSRATTDSNGTLHRKQSRAIALPRSFGNGTCSGDEIYKQRKSTSVIARLMGLEPLTTISVSESSSVHSPHLRRSASESRITRDITHTLLDSANNYGTKCAKSETIRTNCGRNVNQQQRNYNDSADVFPELKQSSASVYGEIERRLSMSGKADGSSKDLEALKHILEAMQLKGLLHSNKSSIDQNFVYERVIESPIVVMKPSRSVESPPPSSSSLAQRRNSPDGSLPSVSPHRRMRTSISPTRSESSSSMHRNRNSASERGRSYSVNSPKPSFRRSFDSPTTSSPRNRTSVVNVKARLNEKISMTLSDDSHNNNNNKGKTLLSRCDMLLQSIADMNSITSSEQPSPSSVLDSCFYKEDVSLSSSPSPVPIRSIDFKDMSSEFEDEDSSWTSSAFSDDLEFLYVADVLRAIACIPEESDRFTLLEKQQCKKGEDGSKSNASKIKRKLIFDNVNEILHRNKQLPPWKADQNVDKSSLVYVWSEFKKIREPDVPDQELVEVICGHLKKELATNSFDFEIEVAESVLDIERLVFKDLIGEAIRDFASSLVLFYPRRKLAF